MIQVHPLSRCVSLRRHLSVATRALCVLGLGLWIAAECQAQWKWRDAAGRIQYSDRPPPQEVPAAAILQRPTTIESSRNAPVVEIQPLKPASVQAPGRGASAPAASAPASAAKASANDAQTEARRKEAQAREDAERRAQEAQLAQQRAQNCLRAQENLRTLESGIRITRINAQGEREFLSDAQRSQALNEAQRIVAADCR